MRIAFIMCCFFFSGLGVQAQITNVTIKSGDGTPPGEDATTNSSSVSAGTVIGGGVGTTMSLTVSPLPSYSRSFVKFNLSSIPNNAIITSAKLILTPSGTENVSTAANTTELTLELCNTSWSETTLTHNTGISNNTLFASVTTSNYNSGTGKREFDVTAHLQPMVEGRVPNNGWRIRRTNETSSTTISTAYFTKESTPSTNWPTLQVSYYIPVSLTASTSVVHESTSGAANGSITPVLTGGSSTTRSYQWYNSAGAAISGATNLTLTGQSYGWYGLKVTGSDPSDVSYFGFMVGLKCEAVNITFNPGVNYMDDALITNYTSGSGTTIVDNGQVNYGSNTGSSAEQWTNGTWYNQRSLMKFRLWIPSDINVQEAKLNLTGFAHYPLHRSNISELTQITSNWREYGVAELNKPTQTATGLIDIPGTLPLGSTGNQNAVVDIASFYNSVWKTNNLANYGIYFQLKSYLNPIVTNGTYTRMRYQSSENTNPPTINFKVDLYSDQMCTPFANLNYEMDGYYYIMKNGLIKFVFNQEYLESNLKFNIYNGMNTLVKTQADFATVATTNGDNYITLDVRNDDCLGAGFFYLEVINSKNEKTYLRFYNDYNNCTAPIENPGQ